MPEMHDPIRKTLAFTYKFVPSSISWFDQEDLCMQMTHTVQTATTPSAKVYLVFYVPEYFQILI